MHLSKKYSLILVPLILGSFCFGARAALIGEEAVFNVDPIYDAIGRNSVAATLRVISAHAYFYIDNAYWDELDNAEKTLFATSLAGLASEFDNVIYPIERAVFGSEWNPGIDGDEKITILLNQLIDEAGGYFNTYDGYSKNKAYMSNEREMLYLNTLVASTPQAKSYLAHEFQHLISFHQKTVLHDLVEDIWLNEARSEYAVTLCGYNDVYAGSYLADRVNSFLDYPEDSLTEWKNNAPDYGVASLFFHYLVNNYGEDVITKMMLNDKVGIASVDQALEDIGSSDTFSDVFAGWTVANYLNDCELGYCYNDENLSYAQVEYSASYSGFPNLIVSRSSAVKDWSPRWYRFRQGTVVPTDKDILKLEFHGIGQNADFNVPYIIMDQNQTTVQFMPLDEDQKGIAYIPDFTSLNKSVVITPFNQYKRSGFGRSESMGSFTFTASSVSRELILIESITPSSGSSGLKIAIGGSGLSSTAQVFFGDISVGFSIVSDQEINFIVPDYSKGKIDIRVIDNEGNESILVNKFNYINVYPEGSLIRAKGGYKVYIIKGGYKRWIQHQDIFNMYRHLSWEDIIDVEPEELNQYQDAWLIRMADDKKVYEINADGTKHWLNMTAEEFAVSGRQWDMVYVVNDFEGSFYKTGADILY